MAQCTDGKGGGCRKPITPGDAKTAHIIKDEATGKLLGMLHNKCYFVALKRARMGPGGRYLENTPTPYEMAAKKVTATDLTDEAQDRKERAHQAMLDAEARRGEIIAKMQAGQTHDGDTSLAELLDAAEAAAKEAKEIAHLAEHQATLADERSKEDHTGSFTDWRDDGTGAEV